jgi:hypothetical protein
MGKQKYNHEVGNVYLMMDEVYHYPNSTWKRYTLRLLVQKKVEKQQERYGMFSITIGQDGKFHIGTNWIRRGTLNSFARHCVIREQFEADGHRLGFLVITGCTLETMIEKAVERYQKNMKTRYVVKFDPDEIKGLLKYVEPEEIKET